jgi:outer membrane protein assembly factor BamB
MKYLSKKCLIGLIFISASLLAQPKAAPAWSAKFSSAINWQRVHSLGYILVSTNNALYAVNPTDGVILWENKSFAALDPSTMEEVAGTEFLAIAYKLDKSSSIPLQAIIKVMDGKVLFDSQKEGIGVLSRHVLPQSGRLLIMGVKQGVELKDLNATVFMYDIQSGKQLWVNDQLFRSEAPKGKGLLAQLQTMGNQLGGLQKLTSEPVETEGKFVTITHPGYVMKLNSATGDLVWKNALMPSQKAKILFSPYKKDVTFIATEVESESGASSGFSSSTSSQPNQPTKFYSNQYYAFNSSTGAPLWKEPAKENDHLNQVIMHEKGLIICPMSSQKPTINFIDYTTGVTSWGKKGKGIKAEGSVVSYITTEKGILITTAFDNAWNSKAEEYYLNVLDPTTATFKYEKSVKLKGDLVRSELIPKGLLFITRREVNILDVNTGLLVWANSIEAGGPSSGDKIRPFPVGYQGDKLFVYSPKDGSVYEVDKQAGTNRKITTTKIEFEGKELPSAIDVLADGLVLSSEQNIMKLDWKGSVLYKKYYAAPREPALLRALYAAQAVRAAYIGAVASAYSAEFTKAAQQTTDPNGKAVGQELAKGFGELGEAGFNYSAQAMKQFSARYKASQSTPNFVIMMTKQEKKGNQLVQVSKTNGDISRAIDIKNDKEPEYDVDQIYNHVYYRLSPAEIVCYKL